MLLMYIHPTNAKETVKQAVIVSMSSQDKTCSDCFCNTFEQPSNVSL